MRRILYIIPYLGMGGTEKHLLDLVRAFSGKDQVWLLAPPGETLEQFTAELVHYTPFPRLDLKLIPGLRAFFRGLKKILTEQEIDLIHIHGAPELMWLVRMVCRKVPILFTVHGFHGPLKGWDYWVCARFCSHFATRVIAVAEAEAEILKAKGVKPGLVRTILNGVPDPLKRSYNKPEALETLPMDSLIVGVIARLETTKGVHFLLQAVAALAPKFPKLRVVIVGAGSKGDELRVLAETLGIAGRVIFTGYQPEIHNFLYYYQILVIPSLHEALPLVLIEGMAQQKPIIATTVGGIPEVVEDGVNGLLVPPGDIPALASALERLIGDPLMQDRLGKQARKTYEREFTAEHMVAQTEEVYREILYKA
ncbi:MAG: glycosyltransferase [Firmicutes bacterium]|nr:glycosyltransferase [Bacillota bacterium]